MADIHTCTEFARLDRIEQGVREANEGLNNANMRLAVVDERLKAALVLFDTKLEKYDRHVEQGEIWRNFLVGNALALALACAGALWWGKGIEADVQRLTALHPYGSSVSPVYGTK